MEGWRLGALESPVVGIDQASLEVLSCWQLSLPVMTRVQRPELAVLPATGLETGPSRRRLSQHVNPTGFHASRRYRIVEILMSPSCT